MQLIENQKYYITIDKETIIAIFQGFQYIGDTIYIEWIVCQDGSPLLIQPRYVSMMYPYNLEYDNKEPDFSKIYVRDKPKDKTNAKRIRRPSKQDQENN